MLVKDELGIVDILMDLNQDDWFKGKGGENEIRERIGWEFYVILFMNTF